MIHDPRSLFALYRNMWYIYSFHVTEIPKTYTWSDVIPLREELVHFFRFMFCQYQQCWPPLWSSGQSFWLQIQRSRVRFPALPDFLSSSGSGTGSTQPREINWGATWIKKVAAPGLEKQRLTAVGTRCADHVTPLYPQKLALTSPTGGGRSVGIVRSRTKATEMYVLMIQYLTELHVYSIRTGEV